ncbi:MAG: hypothetical protein ACREHD_09240, partial [Pirellulales bacterium]
MDDSASATNCRRAVVQVLESLARAGLTELPRRAAVKKGEVAVAVVSRAVERAHAAPPNPTALGTSEDAYATKPAAAAPNREQAAQRGASAGTSAPAANGAALFAAAGWDGAPRLP